MKASNITKARSIYKTGKNSAFPNGEMNTLQKLSLTAMPNYKLDPLYNTYRYAFTFLSSKANFDDEPMSEFADSIVNDLFQEGKLNEALTASVVMNVFMEISHNLYNVVRSCGDGENDLRSLDKAAAYYIGKGQEEGENGSGYMMYHIAENGGYWFDQDEGETMVNTAIINHFHYLKNDVLTKNLCSATNEDLRLTTYESVRRAVNNIISKMTIPLIQNLIYNMDTTGNRYMVELYAIALIPQFVACSSDDYQTLLQKFIMTKYTDKTKSEFDGIVQILQRNYECLGIKCADVGAYKTDVVPICVDGFMGDYAGFKPATNFTKVGCSMIFIQFLTYL